MAWWVYKCNSKGLPYQRAVGDWRSEYFNGDPNQEWGSTDWVPALADLKQGDMIIAYQTDTNELVGLARVRQPCDKDTYLYLEPVEVIRPGVKVRPLRRSDPDIAAIPAFQPGRIATIYEISASDAQKLLSAAGVAYDVDLDTAI
jgi:hypothetical protein